MEFTLWQMDLVTVTGLILIQGLPMPLQLLHFEWDILWFQESLSKIFLKKHLSKRCKDKYYLPINKNLYFLSSQFIILIPNFYVTMWRFSDNTFQCSVKSLDLNINFTIVLDTKLNPSSPVYMNAMWLNG